MHDLLSKGEKVAVKPYDGYWLDIGRPDDYMQGLPYTCTGRIAVVFGVIAASTFLGSRLKKFGSTSQKMGLIPFQCRAWVVATKLYGEVITSPVMRNV